MVIIMKKRLNPGAFIVLVIFFTFGIYFSIINQHEWFLQMFLGILVLVAIVIVKTITSNDSRGILSHLAILTTLVGITVSPEIIAWAETYINKVHLFISATFDLEWISLELYRNSLYVIFLVSIWIITTLAGNLFKDRTVMKRYIGKLPHKFNDEAFISIRDSFCVMLDSDIRKIDVESRWNDYFFAPLDAEVIVEEVNRTKRKSDDLIKALKTETSHMKMCCEP